MSGLGSAVLQVSRPLICLHKPPFPKTSLPQPSSPQHLRSSTPDFLNPPLFNTSLPQPLPSSTLLSSTPGFLNPPLLNTSLPQQPKPAQNSETGRIWQRPGETSTKPAQNNEFGRDQQRPTQNQHKTAKPERVQRFRYELLPFWLKLTNSQSRDEAKLSPRIVSEAGPVLSQRRFTTCCSHLPAFAS